MLAYPAGLVVRSVQAAITDQAFEKGDPMGGENSGKKRGFFGKLLRLAFIGAIVAGVVSFIKRRRGADFDDSEWQELPPPAGG
jgi:hypothetical protein